jgi:uncharacterized membrane protein
VSDLFFGKLLLIQLKNIHFLALVVVILDWNLSVSPQHIHDTMSLAILIEMHIIFFLDGWRYLALLDS